MVVSTISLENYSPGWDNVFSKVIKETFKQFLLTLVHILNLSIYLIVSICSDTPDLFIWIPVLLLFFISFLLLYPIVLVMRNPARLGAGENKPDAKKHGVWISPLPVIHGRHTT